MDTAQLEKKKPLLITIANEGEQTQTSFNDLQQVFDGIDVVSFKTFPEQTHMSTRVNAVMHGLREAFPDWQPSQEIQKGTIKDLSNHYQTLSKRYGFDVEVPLELLARMSGFDSMSDDKEKNQNAAMTVKYTLGKNLQHADKLFNIVDQLVGRGSVEGSNRLVSYICTEIPKDQRCVSK